MEFSPDLPAVWGIFRRFVRIDAVSFLHGTRARGDALVDRRLFDFPVVVE